jgi:redox-sensitive bicupin YhaK (pirin superfamily)
LQKVAIHEKEQVLMPVKEATRLITAHRQTEGAGFVVRRPVPTAGLELVDPFLLIDEMGPVDYAPGEAVGAPDHPHRGFETVTYAIEGEFEHEDSAGHRGSLGPGDVQWMTAGGGIIHSEEPSRRIREQGGRVHGFQIWVNLPARLKMTQPRYQEVTADRIPVAESADGKVRVRVIAGEALGVRAVIDTHTPIVFQDFSLEPGGDASISLPNGGNALVYVFEGSVRVGDSGKEVRDGQMALLGDGDAVRLRGPEAAGERGRALLLAGKPIGEPVARYGPFVMNTRKELLRAFADYESGRMGEINRTARSE